MPVEMFQNTVLSPNPSKPEPLFAEDDVNPYNTCDTPWNCGLVNASYDPGTIKASAVKTKISKGCTKKESAMSFISLPSNFIPK